MIRNTHEIFIGILLEGGHLVDGMTGGGGGDHIRNSDVDRMSLVQDRARVAESGEHGNETLSFIKSGEFLG